MLNKFAKRFAKVAALVLVVVLVLGVMPPGVVLADAQDGELFPVPAQHLSSISFTFIIHAT